MGADIFGTVMERSGYLVGFTACALTGLLLAGLDALLRARPIRLPKPASLLNRLPRLSTTGACPRGWRRTPWSWRRRAAAGREWRQRER
jgi:hypothetical protein